jgi:geranylgeranylglycerol-phosphate geranylgeranyltransferase
MGYLAIIRPVNCLLTALSVWVGAWIGGPLVFKSGLIAAGCVGFATCAFGNIINDLMDVEIDRINNPRRPLPAGTVTRTGVLVEAALWSAVALACALILGRYPVILVLAALVALFAYALFFKRHYVGNLLVALIAGSSFILGGIVGRDPACLIPFLFAILVHLPREIVKDILDIEGDRAAGVKSLPIRFGTASTLSITAILLGLCLAGLPVPFLFKLLGVRYLIIVLAGAMPLLVYALIVVLRKPDRPALARVSLALKAVMLVGLSGFLAG